jgi:hypothetical protein
MSIDPSASPINVASRARALVAPGEDGEIDAGAGEQPRQALEMLAREDFGRREQRALRARLDRDQQRHQRDQRLARADIALEQADHRRALREIALDLGDRPRLRAGRAVGQPQRIAQAPVAMQRLAAAAARRGAHQSEGELVGEEFVIGQPRARFRIGGIGMEPHQCLAPARPVVAREQARLDPFGQIGHALQRLRHQSLEPLERQPFGQRIDCLARGERLCLLGRHHIGMHDLEPLIILFELARNGARLAQREKLLGVARIGAEEDQSDRIAGRIERDDARRRARRAADAIFGRRDGDGDDRAGIGGIERGHRLAIDPAGGEVEDEIDRALQPEPGQRLGERGADAFQGLHFGEQRIENIGAHRGMRCRNGGGIARV